MLLREISSLPDLVEFNGVRSQAFASLNPPFLAYSTSTVQCCYGVCLDCVWLVVMIVVVVVLLPLHMK